MQPLIVHFADTVKTRFIFVTRHNTRPLRIELVSQSTISGYVVHHGNTETDLDTDRSPLRSTINPESLKLRWKITSLYILVLEFPSSSLFRLSIHRERCILKIRVPRQEREFNSRLPRRNWKSTRKVSEKKREASPSRSSGWFEGTRDDLALGQLGVPPRRGIGERLRAADAGPRNRAPDTPQSARALHRVSGPVRPLHLAPKEGCRAWLLAPRRTPLDPLFVYSLLCLPRPPCSIAATHPTPFPATLRKDCPPCALPCPANLFFSFERAELAVVRGPNWTRRFG